MLNIKLIFFKIIYFTFRFAILIPSRLHYFIFKKINVIHKDKDYLRFDSKDFSNDLEKYINVKCKKVIQYKINNYVKKKKDDYFFDINDLLKKDYTMKINNFLSSNYVENIISNNFGFSVQFSHFYLRINFYNPNAPKHEGPKMWHRDNDSLFGQFKLFMVINDLKKKDFGGFFYFLKNTQVPAFVKPKVNYSNKDFLYSQDVNSRVYDDDMKKLYNKKDLQKFGVNKGESLVLDTNETYHKGGYIKNKKGYRIMITAYYRPLYLDFSIVNRKYNSILMYRILTKILIAFKNRLIVQI